MGEKALTISTTDAENKIYKEVKKCLKTYNTNLS